MFSTSVQFLGVFCGRMHVCLLVCNWFPGCWRLICCLLVLSYQAVMVFVDLFTQVWERPSKYFHLVASMVISHPMWVLPFSCSILNSLLWTLPYRPSSLGSFTTFCFLVFVWCRGHLSQPFSNGLHRLKAYLYSKLLLSLRCTSVGLTYCARSPCMHTYILDDMSKHDYASIE